MILFRVLSYPQVPSSSRLVLVQLPVICSTFININIYLMFRAPKRKKNLHFEIPACTGTGITFYFSCKQTQCSRPQLEILVLMSRRISLLQLVLSYFQKFKWSTFKMKFCGQISAQKNFIEANVICVSTATIMFHVFISKGKNV